MNNKHQNIQKNKIKENSKININKPQGSTTYSKNKKSLEKMLREYQTFCKKYFGESTPIGSMTEERMNKLLEDEKYKKMIKKIDTSISVEKSKKENSTINTSHSPGIDSYKSNAFQNSTKIREKRIFYKKYVNTSLNQNHINLNQNDSTFKVDSFNIHLKRPSNSKIVKVGNNEFYDLEEEANQIKYEEQEKEAYERKILGLKKKKISFPQRNKKMY